MRRIERERWREVKRRRLAPCRTGIGGELEGFSNGISDDMVQCPQHHSRYLLDQLTIGGGREHTIVMTCLEGHRNA
jgi:hypothetical protein